MRHSKICCGAFYYSRTGSKGRCALTFAFNSYSNGTVVPAVVEVYIKNDDLYIYFSGTLLAMYFNSYNAKIEWQLLDSSGKVVASDTFSSSAYLDPGETFTDNYDIAYNCIKPGETYTLVIVN